ncbi:DUF4197 domain-containing protein [Thiomicrorhabdus sediminis]|uniref:DUF4197 domain-containing protein n=1 Tax=Thiomicrorhabdus sediminis TaxID=2580412 RepID=A0A4P9K2U1_9GAMM|nr:DUF4197 domain-containing protein [Thiomicrorhabdus sediminis]QCU89139.1 DUF4197 domain-containing protein [Thiomicrorhabdus sediminis]
MPTQIPTSVNLKTQSLLLAGLLSLTLTAPAQANWWEQGAELLKSLQGTADTNTTQNSSISNTLSNTDIETAFKQALSQGSKVVVEQLSVKDGFNADPKIHIPLPKNLQTVQSTLDRFGMGSYMDDVELKLNRAAEAATPEAKKLFLDAISQMTFEDVQKIYKGPQDSATQYLKGKTSPALTEKMKPIVENTLNQVGAIQAYDGAISKYKDLPFVPDVKTDLLNHVVSKALDGMFYYIAEEEAAIRQDPLKQSTELLKKVFGN